MFQCMIIITRHLTIKMHQSQHFRLFKVIVKVLLVKNVCIVWLEFVLPCWLPSRGFWWHDSCLSLCKQIHTNMLTCQRNSWTELHTELYRPANGGDCIRREDEERSRLQHRRANHSYPNTRRPGFWNIQKSHTLQIDKNKMHCHVYLMHIQNNSASING